FAVLLETVQRREQRSRIDAELIATKYGESLRDPVTVHRLASEHRENHQIERALGNVELLHIAPLGNPDEGAMVAWTHLGCQEEDAAKAGSHVFERGARLGGFNQQLRQRALSPRLPHAAGNNSLGFEHRECFEATAGVGLARVGLSGLATERLNRLFRTRE